MGEPWLSFSLASGSASKDTPCICVELRIELDRFPKDSGVGFVKDDLLDADVVSAQEGLDSSHNDLVVDFVPRDRCPARDDISLGSEEVDVVDLELAPGLGKDPSFGFGVALARELEAYQLAPLGDRDLELDRFTSVELHLGCA